MMQFGFEINYIHETNGQQFLTRKTKEGNILTERLKWNEKLI